MRPDPEAARVRALRNVRLLDTEAEAAFSDLARFAAFICTAPIALINLVDRNRVWVKAGVGLACESTDRAHSICSRAIAQPDPLFEIPDLRRDPRFAENPFVLGDPHMRAYAGAVLVVGGERVGTLCVIDMVPRRLTAEQRANLLSLARNVVTPIEYRDRGDAREDGSAPVTRRAGGGDLHGGHDSRSRRRSRPASNGPRATDASVVS